MQDKFKSKVIEELVKQAGLNRLDSTHLRRLLRQNLADLQELSRKRFVHAVTNFRKVHAAILYDIEEGIKKGSDE